MWEGWPAYAREVVLELELERVGVGGLQHVDGAVLGARQAEQPGVVKLQRTHLRLNLTTQHPTTHTPTHTQTTTMRREGGREGGRGSCCLPACLPACLLEWLASYLELLHDDPILDVDQPEDGVGDGGDVHGWVEGEEGRHEGRAAVGEHLQHLT